MLCCKSNVSASVNLLDFDNGTLTVEKFLPDRNSDESFEVYRIRWLVAEREVETHTGG